MLRSLVLLSILALAASTLVTTNSCESNPYKHGEFLYNRYCASCHMDNGSGLEGVIPPLAGADYYTNNQGLVACIIRYGWEDSILVNDRNYHQPMAAVTELNDIEIANVINYINYSWYRASDLPYLSGDQVTELLKACPNIPEDPMKNLPLEIKTTDD